MIHRPWGSLPAVLELASQRSWLFIGSIGTEQRSLAAWHLLRGLGCETKREMVRIEDASSQRYGERTQICLRERTEEFLQVGGVESEIRDFHLMDEAYRIEAYARDIEDLEMPVLLDITSMPKRFFFLILRRLCASDRIKDLVITYTSPAEYEEKEPLSEDCETWKHLPGFVGEQNGGELLIVSVGFLAESLQKHIGSIHKHETMKILIPFPAPLSVLRRTWESVFQLEHNQDPKRFNNHRVDTADMPAAFDRIVSLARSARDTPAFAPFGPKPISAAMCLYAIQKNSTVYYPQPKAYHPDYSRGIRGGDPVKAVQAYWIKHDGEFFYRLD